MPTKDNSNKMQPSWQRVSVRALVLHNGNLLFCKVKPDDQFFAYEAGKWCLPGGIMDRNEDLEQAVIREVIGQSGWTVKHVRLYCIIIYTGPETPDEPQELELIFVAEGVSQTREPENNKDEVRWSPLIALPDISELVSDHADVIFSLAKMLHGGKTLNLDQLPPVFNLKKARIGKSLQLPC